MADGSDIEIIESPIKWKSSQKENAPANTSFDDDSFDIFEVNYSALQKQAMKYTAQELMELDETDEDLKVVDTPVKDTVSTKSNDSDDCVLLTSVTPIDSVDKQGQDNQQQTRSRTGKRKKLDSPVKQKKTKKIGKNGIELAMKKELEALAKLISKDNAMCDQHNQSDVVLLSDEDDDDDVNMEITLRIRWGAEIIRIPIRQLQPFSEVYRQLGEQHGVSPSRIMLSYNHRLIPPTACPHDLAITIVDFLEGGIMEEEVNESSTSSKGTRASIQPHVLQAPDSIALKVQNSNHKATLTIHIGRSDKMKILMHRYAEQNKAKIENLKFFFDGERLNPNDTPISLDLDGGECIDVYQ